MLPRLWRPLCPGGGLAKLIHLWLTSPGGLPGGLTGPGPAHQPLHQPLWTHQGPGLCLSLLRDIFAHHSHTTSSIHLTPIKLPSSHSSSSHLALLLAALSHNSNFMGD